MHKTSLLEIDRIMGIVEFNGIAPTVDATAFVAPNAWIIGDVHIGADSSCFFGAVIRGDIQPIRIGKRTNIQEHALLHTSHDMNSLEIGDSVTIGHRSILHGCRVGSNTLIGMGATILDNAIIGEQCIIGAHSLVTKGTVIAPRSLVMGTPAKIIRTLTPAEISSLATSADNYVVLSREYRSQFSR